VEDICSVLAPVAELINLGRQITRECPVIRRFAVTIETPIAHSERGELGCHKAAPDVGAGNESAASTFVVHIS
jgi:hypothetical protein